MSSSSCCVFTMEESVFRQAIRSIFNAWPAFKIAIDNGVGGHDRLEKLNWLPGAVEEWITENKNLEAVEIEDFLSELLDSTFELWIEDNSLPEIASTLLRCYNLCCEGRFAEVQSQFFNLPSPKVQVQVQGTANDDDDDSDSEEEMNTSGEALASTSNSKEESSTVTSLPNGSTSMDQDADVEEGDDWQEVKRGKGRRK